MNIKNITMMAMALFIAITTLAQAAPKKAPSPTLTLVASKTIPDHFVTAESIYADGKNIHCAGYSGTDWVISQGNGYPLVASIAVSSFPLQAVRGDGKSVYVTGGNSVYAIKPSSPFTVTSSTQLPGSLESLAIQSNTILVSSGSSTVAANDCIGVFAPVNPDDGIAVIDKRSMTPVGSLGASFEPGMIQVLDVRSGSLIATFAKPKDLQGNTNGGVNIYLNGNMIVETTPGPYGSGAYMYDTTGKFLGSFSPTNHPYVNTVVSIGQGLLAAGTEDGWVYVYDVSAPDSPVCLASISLRQVTGFTGLDQIEIRSLWWDAKSSTIIAGSSWNGDASVPSLFILKFAAK
jgi:hypothetical protein